MTRPTKTTSGRWEVKGDPNDPRAKWEHQPGAKWQSKRTGVPDLKKVEKWIEDMEEWSEMMYEAVTELRESVTSIQGIRQQERAEISAGQEKLAERITAVEGKIKAAP